MGREGRRILGELMAGRSPVGPPESWRTCVITGAYGKMLEKKDCGGEGGRRCVVRRGLLLSDKIINISSLRVYLF